jgi:hypothetical protein
VTGQRVRQVGARDINAVELRLVQHRMRQNGTSTFARRRSALFRFAPVRFAPVRSASSGSRHGGQPRPDWPQRDRRHEVSPLGQVHGGRNQHSLAPAAKDRPVGRRWNHVRQPVGGVRRRRRAVSSYRGGLTNWPSRRLFGDGVSVVWPACGSSASQNAPGGLIDLLALLFGIRPLIRALPAAFGRSVHYHPSDEPRLQNAEQTAPFRRLHCRSVMVTSGAASKRWHRRGRKQ